MGVINMRLLNKQLLKDVFKNRMFVILLFLLIILTSFMYFYVHFSIDANMEVLSKIDQLSKNQNDYLNALQSNTILARNFLLILGALTSFVFGMFFYRIYKSYKKDIGCLRALGYKAKNIRSFFTVFTFILSIIGTILGVIAGYFGSNVLIKANMQTYLVSDLKRGISIDSLLVGTIVISVIFSIVAFISYYQIKRTELAFLIHDYEVKVGESKLLQFANFCVKALPVKNKFAIRIGIRRPVSLLLIFTSVMGFMVMSILGISLNWSSGKIYDSQLQGRSYKYDTKFNTELTKENTNSEVMYYLEKDTEITSDDNIIKQKLIGVEGASSLFELEDSNGDRIEAIDKNTVYINPGLEEIYGIKEGSKVELTVNNKKIMFNVAGIAVNAELNGIYVSMSELTELMGLPSDSFNGVLSNEIIYNNGNLTTMEQRKEVLKRNSVSSNASGVTNQIIGWVVGCILIYLALLLNFQDSTKDMIILKIIGYKNKAIRKMLVDIYKPLIFVSFIIALYPSIRIAMNVQKVFSIQTGDYIPFQTNIIIILGILMFLYAIYYLVQFSFSIKIKGIFKKDAVKSFTNV